MKSSNVPYSTGSNQQKNQSRHSSVNSESKKQPITEKTVTATVNGKNTSTQGNPVKKRGSGKKTRDYQYITKPAKRNNTIAHCFSQIVKQSVQMYSKTHVDVLFCILTKKESPKTSSSVNNAPSRAHHVNSTNNNNNNNSIINTSGIHDGEMLVYSNREDILDVVDTEIGKKNYRLICGGGPTMLSWIGSVKNPINILPLVKNQKRFVEEKDEFPSRDSSPHGSITSHTTNNSQMLQDQGEEDDDDDNGEYSEMSSSDNEF